MNDLILTTIKKEEIQSLIEEALKKVLLINEAQAESNDTFLDVDHAAAFLGIAKPTLYAKCAGKTIPHIKKGKKLYFQKNELVEYLKSGRQKTEDQMRAEIQIVASPRRKKS